MTADAIAGMGHNWIGDNRGEGVRTLRRIMTVIALVCTLIAYIFLIVRLHPTYLFGVSEDDAIYMSSAKAIAAGKGYVLPELPGSPPATKYPILYSWVLSLVWRLNPSFPANLSLAISISVVFGVGFLMAAFGLFSWLGGFSRTEALALTAYLAVHPLVQFFGASILTEMPFAFLALTSMLLADRSMRPGSRLSGSVSCGVLVGISAMTRILGIPIILGIILAGIVRRSWRQLAAFSVFAAPFLCAVTWKGIFSTKPSSPIPGAVGQSLGWVRAWIFYTDYLGMWKLSVPGWRVLRAMLKNNAGVILREPADLLFGPTFITGSVFGRCLVLLAASAATAGIVRQARVHGWKPIHLCLGFYAPVVLLWNYPAANRFFLPFWPLVVAGVWVEGRRVAGLVKSAITPAAPMLGKFIGAFIGLVLVAFTLGTIQNLTGGIRSAVKGTSDERRALIGEKQECFEWISANTAPDARLVAYEDAVTYLYTGRQTVRPIIFSTDDFYEPKQLALEASHVSDIALAIRASYWLSAADDYYRDWSEATAFEEDQLGKLEREFPVVYRSRGGHVTVRSTGCYSNGCASPCRGCGRLSAYGKPADLVAVPAERQ